MLNMYTHTSTTILPQHFFIRGKNEHISISFQASTTMFVDYNEKLNLQIYSTERQLKLSKYYTFSILHLAISNSSNRVQHWYAPTKETPSEYTLLTLSSYHKIVLFFLIVWCQISHCSVTQIFNHLHCDTSFTMLLLSSIKLSIFDIIKFLCFLMKLSQLIIISDHR